MHQARLKHLLKRKTHLKSLKVFILTLDLRMAIATIAYYAFKHQTLADLCNMVYLETPQKHLEGLVTHCKMSCLLRL